METHQQTLTTWSAHVNTVQHMLLSNNCSVIVDGSFFPDRPEFILAHWKFILHKKIVGKGGFVAKVESHHQSAYAAEACGGLGVLSSVRQIMDKLIQKKTIDLLLGTDCQSVIHKFSSTQRVTSFDSKLSYEVREFLSIRNTYIRKMHTFKIASHQDKVKKLHELSFAERVNILCDEEAKKLIRE